MRRSPRLGRVVTLAAVALLAVTCSGSADETIVERADWGEVFAAEDVTGTFVLREVGTGTTQVWNADRATERRLPASTFKILNSLIILETEVLTDADESVSWDGIDRGVDAWNRDHSLRSGIEVSAVWMYQEMARRVDEGPMATWVERAGYGNADIGGGIDEFWLRGALRISPVEQADFLERLATGDLPFRPEVVAAVSDILVRERGPGWTWAHKTGTALADDPPLGWLVGIADWNGASHVFALNLDLAPVDDVATEVDPQVRQRIARTILVAEGALP